jgi:hypothetical protein
LARVWEQPIGGFIGGAVRWLAFHGGTDAEGDGRDVMAVARGDVAAIQGSAVRGERRGRLLAWQARPLALLGAERRHARGQVRARAASSRGGEEQREGKAAGGDGSSAAPRGVRGCGACELGRASGSGCA